jgi:hypothetical protein
MFVHIALVAFACVVCVVRVRREKCGKVRDV